MTEEGEVRRGMNESYKAEGRRGRHILPRKVQALRFFIHQTQSNCAKCARFALRINIPFAIWANYANFALIELFRQVTGRQRLIRQSKTERRWEVRWRTNS